MAGKLAVNDTVKVGRLGDTRVPTACSGVPNIFRLVISDVFVLSRTIKAVASFSRVPRTFRIGTAMRHMSKSIPLCIVVTVSFLLGASGQVCTDFGKDIEGAAVDKQGNFFAVNGVQPVCTYSITRG